MHSSSFFQGLGLGFGLACQGHGLACQDLGLGIGLVFACQGFDHKRDLSTTGVMHFNSCIGVYIV